MRILPIWILLSVNFSIALHGEPTTSPFSVRDMISMKRLGEVVPSNDGKWIVYTQKIFDKKENKFATSLWLMSSDAKRIRRLTASKFESISSLIWSPNSESLAYLSNKSGSTQIWVLNQLDSKPQKLSDYPIDVSNLRWSPDGSHIAFSAEVYVDLLRLSETAKLNADKEKNPVNVLVFDKLMVRHWDTWFEGKRSHVFIQPVKFDRGKWNLNGEPSDLMSGIDADSPTKPFGGIEDFNWSPDGKELAFTAHLGGDRAWTTDLNIFLVSVDDKKSSCLTCENKAMDKNPVYSPDGKSIAYLAMKKPGFEADRTQIRIYDRESKTTRTIFEDWDFSVDSILFSEDSKNLFVTVQDTAREKIFSLQVSGNDKPKPIVQEHHNALISALPDGTLVFKQDSMLSPAEIWKVRGFSGNPEKLTQLNENELMPKMSAPDEFYFEGALNEKVHAWILKPVDYEEGKKYPVAFLVHGGPQSAFTDSFSYRWNPQFYAGAGFAVIMINFHGSTGYGQAFTDSISGDWGGKPYEDLMKGLDYALSKYSWLNGDRVCALGASYGGYMVNWINGQTDRFKCLVNHDGIFDNFGMYFSTEELWFPEWEHHSSPMKNSALYDKFSPARHVKNWKTPTLVIHGGKDFRVVDTEGISTFTALQRQGVPSKFVYFPKENHWVLNPINSVFWHEEVLDWLNKWLKN